MLLCMLVQQHLYKQNYILYDTNQTVKLQREFIIREHYKATVEGMCIVLFVGLNFVVIGNLFQTVIILLAKNLTWPKIS